MCRNECVFLVGYRLLVRQEEMDEGYMLLKKKKIATSFSVEEGKISDNMNDHCFGWLGYFFKVR